MGNRENAVFAALENTAVTEILSKAHTPCYAIDEKAICKNGEILKKVALDTGCKILLAQKAFSNYNFYGLLSQYIAGTEASGLYEARLGYEEMPCKEVHVFSAAYREDEFEEILKYADHIVFNSVNQLKKYGFKAKEKGKSIGLRINPQCSTQEGHEIYDPCAKGSRLGVTLEVFEKEMTQELVNLLDGLHFHTLCEQNSDDLKTTLMEVDRKFGHVLEKMKWLNMGGGHHITRLDYDIETLEFCINFAKEKYGIEVYLEPGEAVALNAGFLVTKVLDIVENGGIKIAVLDASAACHTPDVIEMPYTAPLFKAKTFENEEFSNHYRLAGPTCLSGDVFGDYYFENELKIGDTLIFGDMAIYTTCKNNTFNGMKLPGIYSIDRENKLCEIAAFGYEDFKMRLGK